MSHVTASFESRQQHARSHMNADHLSSITCACLIDSYKQTDSSMCIMELKQVSSSRLLVASPRLIYTDSSVHIMEPKCSSLFVSSPRRVLIFRHPFLFKRHPRRLFPTTGRRRRRRTAASAVPAPSGRRRKRCAGDRRVLVHVGRGCPRGGAGRRAR